MSLRKQLTFVTYFLRLIGNPMSLRKQLTFVTYLLMAH